MGMVVTTTTTTPRTTTSVVRTTTPAHHDPYEHCVTEVWEMKNLIYQAVMLNTSEADMLQTACAINLWLNMPTGFGGNSTRCEISKGSVNHGGHPKGCGKCYA